MKPANTPIIDLLNAAHGTSATFFNVDCYTILAQDGTVLRFTDGDGDLVLTYPSFPGDTRAGTFTFSSSLNVVPLPDQKTGKTLTWSVGVQVDVGRMALTAKPDVLFDGTNLYKGFSSGKFDNADIWIERVPMVTYGTVLGSIPIFRGNISDITEVSRISVKFEFKDRRQLLDSPVPMRRYQQGCSWGLFGAGCSVMRSAFEVTGSIASGSGPLLLQLAGLGQADNYFNQGILTFTSGVNAGIQVEVRSFVAGSPAPALLFVPLDNAPAPGDTFTIVPGCDHTQSTCHNKFSYSGTVNTSGTAVAWASGTKFSTQWATSPGSAHTIIINGVSYTISQVVTTTSLILASSAGTQTGVAFAFDQLQNYGGQDYIPVPETAV